VRQSISGPVAVIAIALALLGSLVIFNRAKLAPAPAAPFVLPPAPPVDEAELSRLRRSLSPLGISAVWPPLAEDRFKNVRVAWVMPGSPAAVAGVRPGDAIQSFNGIATPNPFALAAAMARVDPDTQSETVVVRAGEEQTLVVSGIEQLSPEARVF
jgi:S1-C subfamily serine protease